MNQKSLGYFIKLEQRCRTKDSFSDVLSFIISKLSLTSHKNFLFSWAKMLTMSQEGK